MLASVPGDAVLEPAEVYDESPARPGRLLERVTQALAQQAIDVVEDDESLTATCSGGDLGLLIRKHGQTIAGLQTLAIAILAGGEGPRKDVVVDAEGYRERRRRILEALAVRCAEQALHEGARVELEPMSAAERKLVHERLKDYDGVHTASEGEEPHRYVVVESPDAWPRAIVGSGLTALSRLPAASSAADSLRAVRS